MLAVAPQQELPPDLTRRAACPYFSFTTSFMSLAPASMLLVLMNSSPTCRFERSVRALKPCFACSTRRREIAITPEGRRCSRCNAGKSLHCALRPGLPLSAFPDGERESSSGYQHRFESPRQPGLRDAPRVTVA